MWGTLGCADELEEEERSKNEPSGKVVSADAKSVKVWERETGKTYTTFQIIWRLWKSRHVKRVLFLVDRWMSRTYAFST